MWDTAYKEEKNRFFHFNPYRMRLVNSIYQTRLEAKNMVPCMILPREGEFVPSYTLDPIQKRLDNAVDQLPAAKIPSHFMETLVGYISFFDKKHRIYYRPYQLKSDYRLVFDLIEEFAFEQYPTETFRYFLQNWPDLCIIAFTDCQEPVGVIIGQKNGFTHGYIAYTYVKEPYRRKKVGSYLLKILINRMHLIGIREVITEVDTENNSGLLLFYLKMGFIKERHLKYYYRNGWDAWRMKMWIYKYDLDIEKYDREVNEKIQYLKHHMPVPAEKSTGDKKSNDKSKSPKSKSPKSPKSPKKSKK